MNRQLTTSRATYNGREIKVRYTDERIDSAWYIEDGSFCSIDISDQRKVLEEAQDRK